MDFENPPPSLETRQLLESFKADSSYPFLRAVRWIILGGAVLYGAVGLFLSTALVAEEMTAGTRDTVIAWGGPDKGTGGIVAFIFLLTVAFRIVLILGTAEGIKLLLDLKQGQRDLARQQDEVAGAIAAATRPVVNRSAS